MNARPHWDLGPECCHAPGLQGQWLQGQRLPRWGPSLLPQCAEHTMKFNKVDAYAFVLAFAHDVCTYIFTFTEIYTRTLYIYNLFINIYIYIFIYIYMYTWYPPHGPLHVCIFYGTCRCFTSFVWFISRTILRGVPYHTYNLCNI